jgi:hypothetical protein
MADETKDTTSSPTPLPAESPAAPARGPLTIMKGGTVSSQTESYYAAMMEDTKRRWAERDQEKADAKNAQGSKTTFASDRTYDLGQPGTNPVAILGYHRPGADGGEYQYMQADVTMMTDNLGQPDEAFVIVCPRCVDRKVPQTLCQMTVRKSNRKWHLDTRSQGDFFVDDDGAGYTLAGKIICEEKIRCPDPTCDGVYQIGEYPRGKEGRRGSSGMWRV